MSGHHGSASSTPWLVWAAIFAIAVLYATAATRRAGWNRLRTASFMAGAALLVAGFAPPVVAWANADLRGHMAQHLVLGMFAPLLLVLAAPVTLLLGSIPATAARGLVALLHSAPSRVLTHPVTALVLNVGGMAVLYATSLYAASRVEPWLHALVHWHFIAAGCLFCWSIAGPDPAPGRPSLRYRGAVLVAGIALHATLAKLMYAYGWPQGTGAPPEQIREAAQWMYYGGDVAEMLLATALLATWYRDAGRGLTAAAAPARQARARAARPG